ncbi:MAG: efflux RND transporter periplasmic adaptor subunit [Gemmatimonadota bacterium]|nr:MAG: efflux RND transporter periplasmic adaptor subunit [Gemmatimonadota bacterium]
MLHRDRIVSLIVGLIAASMLGACQGEERPEPVIRPVRYQEAYSTGGSRVRTFSGTARAGVESRISFKVPGTIRRVAVEVGDTVRAGQLIAQLDDEDYRLQVQRADAGLAQARAQARNAAADYARARQLYENANLSLSELDAARTASESAASSVSAYERELELARLQLSYTRLTAPVAGAVASLNVEANENVQTGQTVVLLTSGSNLEVEVGVPGVLIREIAEGDEVRTNFDALPRQTFSGVVTEVGIAATGAGLTFPVTVRLSESGTDIRPGMSAEVGFLFESESQRVVHLVPSASVGEDREGRFVFIVEPTEAGLGIVRRRPVSVGDLTPEGLEILEGLVDGDRIVTAGWSKIEDGLRVRLPGNGL